MSSPCVLSVPAISPAQLGLVPAEIKLLESADVNGDHNGVATATELSDYRAETMRAPSQVLASEPWLQRQLGALQTTGNIGVRVGAGEVNRVQRSVTTTREVTLEGFYQAGPNLVGIPGSVLPSVSIALDRPVVVNDGPIGTSTARQPVFGRVYVVGPTRESATRGATLPENGDHVRATGTLETFQLFHEDGSPSATYLRFEPGASVQPFGLDLEQQQRVRDLACQVELDRQPSAETMMELFMAPDLVEVTLASNDIHGTGRYAVLRPEHGDFFIKVTETGANGEEMMSTTYYGPYSQQAGD